MLKTVTATHLCILLARYDESSTVLYLVSEFKCDLNMSNNEGCIPLHYALSSNLALEAIKAVSSGCTIKCKQNNVGKTPLHIACENMQYLNNVKRKVLVNLVWDEECICVQDNEGNTPLHIACQRRSVVTAHLLNTKVSHRVYRFLQCKYHLKRKKLYSVIVQ